MLRLTRDFFDRPTVEVARRLLGQRLVRIEEDNLRSSGIIVETEAYVGGEDLACHARAGHTARNSVMWGPPGHAYVYFTYGMHWLLNFVTEREGFPAAVLIRAIEPEENEPRMRRRRGRGRGKRKRLTDGPAKLCQALAIDSNFHGCDVCQPEARLFLETRPGPDERLIQQGPRVGLNSVPEPWKSKPWRFWVEPQKLPVRPLSSVGGP